MCQSIELNTFTCDISFAITWIWSLPILASFSKSQCRYVVEARGWCSRVVPWKTCVGEGVHVYGDMYGESRLNLTDGDDHFSSERRPTRFQYVTRPTVNSVIVSSKKKYETRLFHWHTFFAVTVYFSGTVAACVRMRTRAHVCVCCVYEYGTCNRFRVVFMTSSLHTNRFQLRRNRQRPRWSLLVRITRSSTFASSVHVSTFRRVLDNIYCGNLKIIRTRNESTCFSIGKINFYVELPCSTILGFLKFYHSFDFSRFFTVSNVFSTINARTTFRLSSRRFQLHQFHISFSFWVKLRQNRNL